MTTKNPKHGTKKPAYPLIHMTNAIVRLFQDGTDTQRDALRTVANSVLNNSNRFRLETKESMTLTQAYSHLGSIELTGKQARVCKQDEAYAIEDLLSKDVRKNFETIIHNLAITLVYTSTEDFDQTKQPDVWSSSAEDNAMLLRRAFMYWLTQEGIKQVFDNIEPFCHTNLPMFVFSVFDANNDVTEGHILGTHLFDLFNEDLTSESLSFTSRSIPVAPAPKPVRPHTEVALPSQAEMRYALINEAGEDADDVDEMDDEELADAWKRHNNLPVEDDEDEDEEEDETTCWKPGNTEISVRPDFPNVVVPTVDGRRIKNKNSKVNSVTLPAGEWHKLPEVGARDYYWSIHVISRPTTVLEVNTATLAEALLIAQTLSGV